MNRLDPTWGAEAELPDQSLTAGCLQVLFYAVLAAAVLGAVWLWVLP